MSNSEILRRMSKWRVGACGCWALPTNPASLTAGRFGRDIGARIVVGISGDAGCATTGGARCRSPVSGCGYSTGDDYWRPPVDCQGDRSGFGHCQGDRVLIGQELEHMSEAELDQQVDHVSIYARVSRTQTANCRDSNAGADLWL